MAESFRHQNKDRHLASASSLFALLSQHSVSELMFEGKDEGEEEEAAAN
jgi:hypothetical protein